jgi:hypothetical protein
VSERRAASGRVRSDRPTSRTIVGLAIVVVAASVTLLVLHEVRASGAPRTCNGVRSLCALRLDEVSLATTHNSMNDAADGFSYPNQERGIGAQLDEGVRGFLVDAYSGWVRPVGDGQVVYTDLTDRRLARIVKAVGDEPAQQALQVRAQAGAPDPGAPSDVYLCHQFCELGAVLLRDVLDVLSHFLEEHRDEVVVMVIQDELAPEDLAPVLRDGTIDEYLASLDPSRPLPTLGEMVDSGHRLVLGLENGDLGADVPNIYDVGLVQDVAYKYSSVAELEGEESCARHRGRDDAPLLLVNHWVSPPSVEAAAAANAEEVLLARAQRCAEERGQPVNLLAVDFYATGDLLATVDELNSG